MRVHLGGHLAYYHPDRQHWLEFHLSGLTPLRQAAALIGVPPEEIFLVVINDEVIDPDQAMVSDQDTLQLYPPIDGG
ncbi:MAG TPA: hypothetical protein VMT46_05080 [Anaerolineaceae bacterium]|nr:hypothetical protein [Anaerolineaceae bacterium]